MFRKRTKEMVEKAVNAEVITCNDRLSVSSSNVVLNIEKEVKLSDVCKNTDVSNEICVPFSDVKYNDVDNSTTSEIFNVGLDEIPIWTEDNNIIIENLTNDDAVEISFDLQPTIMTMVLDSTDKVLQTTNLDIGQTVETVTSCNPGISAQECGNLENDSTRPTATSNSTIVGLDLEHPSAYKTQVNDEVVLNQRKPDLLQINDKSIRNNDDALPITTNTTSAEPGLQLTKKGQIRKRKRIEENKEEKSNKRKECLKKKHCVLPPCNETCFLRCCKKICEEQRTNINQQFWEKSWIDRRAYVLSTCERLETKKHTTGAEIASIRKKTFKYFFFGEDGQKVQVCKTFFLTTLGYNSKNDRFIFEVLSKTSKQQISPNPDKRGKKKPANFIAKEDIINHILSFHPQIAHYRREHAPQTLYLPSDVNITLMHKDFLETHPHMSSVSYDVYRCQVKKLKISFAKLGQEECETCEQFKLHGHTQANIEPNCTECQSWENHISKAKESRALYQDQKQNVDPDTLVVSADMQKIIMLPRVESFKKVLFTKRLIAYHESFVPIGNQSSEKAFAVLWHEAITGRNKEDLVSSFYAFLKHYRDFKNIVIWLDNCFSQNKNWCFYTFLVQIINSNEISCESIVINYFEAGHTFMSADSFHHNVEQALKKMGKVYDFDDFVSAVKPARKNVEVKVIGAMDFYKWKDFTSKHKLNNDPERTYMCDIVQVKARRGKFTLEFKTKYNGQEKELDFLMTKFLKKKTVQIPEALEKPQGFPKAKRDNILKELGCVLPDNRKQFWKNLPVCD